MSVSLIIPCDSLHIKYINDLLLEIKKQTYIPDEIIVILSNLNEFPVENEKIEKIKELAQKLNFNFLIRKFINKQYVHQNREIGFNLATKDILILQDADDIPHPQRIEIIKYFFDNNLNCKHLLHGWSNKIITDNIDIEKIKLYQYPMLTIKKRKHKITTHGVFSIKKDFVKNIPWKNWYHLKTGHDKLMNNYLAKNFNKTYYIQINEIYHYRNYLTSWSYYRNKDKEKKEKKRQRRLERKMKNKK